ncbi:unnamed protein product [Rhizoctonia solani]|uniref:Uncharacterized protein n=1 Tax=Rhizoctonia solani TaxID=456999 RepID=A0A8H3GJ37_9AGAM|nr:unnamed protein product [Rhizoctonia solani]
MDSHTKLKVGSLGRCTESTVGIDTTSSQTFEASPNLVRAQSGPVSAFPKLPTEVLSMIFANVIFNHDPDGTGPLSMEQEIQLIYRHLYHLIGVCSTWRKILVEEGALWSIIPVVSNPHTSNINQCPTRLFLQRAGRRNLHLAAVIESPKTHKDLIGALRRQDDLEFHAVNLSANALKLIRNAIRGLFQYSGLEPLSKLSIQCTYKPNRSDRLLRDSDYIFPWESTYNDAIATLTCMLSAFHISGVHLHWGRTEFSHRLVELQIDNVNLGYDGKIFLFLQALSSASELRDLRLMSTTTLRQSSTASNMHELPAVSLPKLRSLYIQDLYFNTLELLLPIIAPGSHHLTLFLTEKSVSVNMLKNNFDEHGQECEINRVAYLCAVLKSAPVDTLVLSGHWGGTWLSEELLPHLLWTLPALKTLKMDDWEIYGPIWNDLKQTQDAQLFSRGPFPALERLLLSSVTIHNMDSFQDMVSSHPLRQVILGANVKTICPDGTCSLEPLQEDSDVVLWLRNNVPDFRLVDSHYSPPEFRSNVWQLW